MKILMLSPIFPWPLDMGSKIRVYHSLKELSRRHDITFVSLAEKMLDKEATEPIKAYCRNLNITYGIKSRRRTVLRSCFSIKPYRVVKFWSKGFRTTVNGLLRQDSFDILWIHFLNIAAVLDLSLSQPAVVVLDQHNADELFWRRYFQEGSLAQKIFAKQNLWKLRRFEKKILPCVDLILSTSDAEAAMMKSLARQSCAVWTTPNGVDTEYFKPSLGHLPNKNIILFCGSMDIAMNVDATIRFAREYFPFIKKEIPDAEFWIVGRNPTSSVRKLATIDRVHVTGSVEDVRAYYEEALVVVAPFKFGGGTKLKILEAMAMGVPVVSSSVGCQGINAAGGRDLVIEDRISDFVHQVIDLMRNGEKRKLLASNARKLVQEHYSWEHIYGNTEQKISQFLNEKSGTLG